MPVNETSLLLDPEAGVSLKTEPAAKTPLVAAAPKSKKFLYVVALVGFVAGTATITAAPRVAAKFWIVMNGSGCTTNQHFGSDVILGGSAAGCTEVPADTPEPGSAKPAAPAPAAPAPAAPAPAAPAPAAPAPAAHGSGHEHETTAVDDEGPHPFYWDDDDFPDDGVETEACERKCTTDADCATRFPEFNQCGYCQNWGESPSMECDGTAPPTEGVDDNTIGDDWNTAGPVVAKGEGAAAAAAKAAAGMDETSPSSTAPPFSVGPCVKNSDGGTDC